MRGSLLSAVILLAVQAALAAEPTAAQVSRGAKVFRANCALCHGEQGHGDGRAARLYTPPPADLTRSTQDTRAQETIIRRGGAALGRSSAMPAWDDVLTRRQIADLMAFLGTVRQRTPPAERAGT